jgi:peptidoglycan/LPS O-acetylase OafA/YrhL
MAIVALTSCVAAYASSGQLHTSPILFALAFGINLWFFSDLDLVLQKMKKSGHWIIYWLLEPWLLIGAMSYSLYLLHVKLYLIPLMFVRQLIDPASGLFSLFTIIGTLIICYPFYYYIERKFLSKNYQKIHRELVTDGTAQVHL